MDLQNDVMVPYNEVYSGTSQYSVAAVVQPNNVGPLPSTATPVRNNNGLNEQAPLSPEDGRINFSNRTPNHGTRHVVNMLGKVGFSANYSKIPQIVAFVCINL